MKKQIINSRIVLPSSVLENGVCIINDGIIEYVGNDKQENIETIDANGKYLVAGYIDIHCHGGNNFDFMDASPEEMLEISKFHLSL